MTSYTIPVQNVTDPNTGEVGTACQLTKSGLSDLTKGINGKIYKFYSDKNKGVINCYTKGVVIEKPKETPKERL